MALTTVPVELANLDGAVTVNESSADADFRVESNGSANMLFVDGGNDEVVVQRASSGATATAGSVFIVEDDDNAELSILGGSSSLLAINFGHSGDADDGIISYNTTSGSEAMAFTVNAAERMRIDSSGRVLIGLGTADTLYGGVVPALQVEGTGAHDSAIGIFRNSNDGSGPYLSMGKSRGTADNSDTIVQSGDTTGIIAFTGADGGERMRATAAIKSLVDGTPGDNDMPGRLSFWTTPDGAYDEVERMRIDSAGKVGIGAASSGDDLHVTNGSTSCNVRISGEGNINKKAQIGYDASAGPYVQAGSSGINTLKFYVDNTSLAMTIAANDVISGDFNDTSDVALKENIVDLESATEKLKQLKPRIFDWKNPDKEKGVGGFIAQEVETVIPKAVVGNDYVADTYYADGDTIPDGKEIGDLKTAGDPGKAVNTSAILAYAVKAIQELEAKVKALEEA